MESHLKKKNIIEDENDKLVRTSTGGLLKKKETPKDEIWKRLRN